MVFPGVNASGVRRVKKLEKIVITPEAQFSSKWMEKVSEKSVAAQEKKQAKKQPVAEIENEETHEDDTVI